MSSSCAAIAVALAISLVPAAPASAQPGGAPAVSDTSLVIIADNAPNPTANARIRATLYELARSRGYTPSIGLDVNGMAERHGLLRDGVVTSDPRELESLRTALGVGVLVRVSKESEQGGSSTVRVAVTSNTGSDSRLVETTGAATPPIENALAQLLPETGAGPAEPDAVSASATASASAGGLLPADDARAAPPTTTEAGEIRRAWDARGGARLTYGVHGIVTAQQTRNVPFRDSETGDRGESEANGIGAGVGGRVGLIYFPVPDPTLSHGSFPVFRLGAGLDMNFLWVRNPEGFDYEPDRDWRTVTYESQALWIVNAPLHAGMGMAFGEFKTLRTWRGAIVGIAYAPAFQFELDMKEAPSEGEFRFNYAGAEISVDIANLNTTEKEETQIRFTLFGLYPIDDARPGLLSATFGAAWY